MSFRDSVPCQDRVTLGSVRCLGAALFPCAGRLVRGSEIVAIYFSNTLSNSWNIPCTSRPRKNDLVFFPRGVWVVCGDPALQFQRASFP